MNMEDREREEFLRQQYECIIEQLSAKAIEASDIVSARTKELEDERKKREEVEAALYASEVSASETRGKLESLRNDYDMQVQAMTEFAASLQEQVERLDVEMSDLRTCQVQCGTCHEWNTVEYLTTTGAYGKICSKGDHPTLTFKRC